MVKVMGKIKVVTDSAADIPSELAQRLDITVLPCYIIFGSEVYRDGVDLTPREFYDKLAMSPILPTTSQPPLGLFVETYQNLLQKSDGIVSIHIASTLSGIFNAARVAADALSPDPIVVIDSQQLSMGAGWQVIMAAKAAQEGHTLEEVVSLVQAVQPRVRAAAMLDNLEHVRRGGRISRVTALMGTALRVKPLLQIGATDDPYMPGVPQLSSLAKTDEQKAIFSLLSNTTRFSRAYWVAPDVPKDRVKILRDAFMATMKDPAFLAAAKKANMEVSPSSPEQIEAALHELANTPPEYLKKMRGALSK